MKVIIAGSRDFDDYEKLCGYCDYLLQNKDDIEIVSGTARGADKLGERYAEERGYPVKRFAANWDKYGKRAGFIRNEDMAEHADALIAFWVDESRGTEHMIQIANDKKLQIRIYRYGKNN